MRRTAFCLLLAGLGVLRLGADVTGDSFGGQFLRDDDKHQFFFTLASAQTVTLRTYSYAGGVNTAGATIPRGGFDSTLSLFDGNGNLIAYNRDGSCGSVGVDAITSFCWDAYLQLTLPAGDYRVILTQGDNVPNGPTLADSFVYDGQANFTIPPGNAAPGFWDYFPNQRTPAFAVDVLGATSSQTTTITSSNTLPSGVATRPYQTTLTAVTGPSVSLTWTMAQGNSLPAGLALDPATGIISGTPTSTGGFSFTVQVTDGVQTVSQVFTVNIASAVNPVTITTLTLPQGAVNQSYSATLGVSGGSGSGSWSGTGLPAGLTLSSNGVISGAPTAGGTFPVQVTYADTSGSFATANLSLLVVYAPLQITSGGNLGEFVPGSNVANAPKATGGATPYRWSATGLPGGFNLNAATGEFSGEAPSPGNYSFRLSVADAQTPAASTSITVSFSVLGILSSGGGTGTTNTQYSQTFSGIGGQPPYIFTGTGIPAGLSLSSAGVLSGTPAAAGNFGFVIQVSDGTGLRTSLPFSIVVTGGASPLSVSGGPLPDGTVSTAYSASVSANGGTPPYTWSVSGGALPDGGTTLGTDGFISGSPKTPGTYTFTALATDSTGTSARGTFTIKVTPEPLQLTSIASFPVGIQGSDYPLQILSASGGAEPYTFTITGALPDGLTFSDPQISGTPTAAGNFGFTVKVTDSAGTQASGTASIKINPPHPDLEISQSTVSFSLTVGSADVPASNTVPVRSSDVTQILNFTVAATPPVSWLNVTGGGTTPGSVGIAIDPSALSLGAAAALKTSITVTCVTPSPCAGNTQTIAVTLNVSAPAPRLTLSSTLLSFSTFTTAPAGSSQTFGLQNTGGGSLKINGITSSDSWLKVTGTPGTVQSGSPVNVTVTTDPAGLSGGYHLGFVTVSTSGGTTDLPVALNVTQPLVTLAPGGQQYEAPAGNPPGNTSGSFQVSVNGGGTTTWNASVLPGAPWLSVNSSTGVASPEAHGTVSFSIDPVAAAALAVNDYYGVIRVTSSGIANSPVDFQVVLNILPASTPVDPDPGTGGLIFTSGTGSESTAGSFQARVTARAVAGSTSQTIPIYASSTTPVAYQASTKTLDGAGWLSVSPAKGFASASAPGQSAITTNTTGLPAGVYRGGVSYAFSSAAVRTVNITLVIPPAGTGASTASISPLSVNISPAAGVCTPAKLVPTQVGLVSNFAQPAGWPTPLSVNVVNDCGTAVTNAQVVATFSNGDPPLILSAADTTSGTFTGTWTPRSVSAQVTINARATAPSFPAAPVQIIGQVTANAVPILAPHGTLHVFNPQVGGALAPGAIVQIYGTNLAGGVTPSSSVPLTTSLGGTSVIVGGIQAPLYYVSPGQVNAQLPYELTAGNTYQILVSAGGALSTPDSFQLDPASTGVAAFSTGAIIAQHAVDYSLVTEAAPAAPGESLIFYLAGLGETDNPVPTGAGAPTTTLSHPLVAPTLTLNGNPIPVQFVGLTPTAVGLYQINFQVPAGTPGGDLKLVVTQQGLAGNTTILPVKN